MAEAAGASLPEVAARALFFAHLSETADVPAAATAAGLALTQVRRWRREDAAFAQDWEAAVAAARDHLEMQLLARALGGERRTLYYGGKAVGEQREFNDSLAMFFLRAHQPHVYGSSSERRTALLPKVDVVAAQIEIEKRLEALAARLAAQDKQ